MSKRRRWLWAFAAFCAVAVFVLVWQRLSAPQQVVLSNRCEVKLRALTLGTNHVYVPGNIFQRTIGRKLPDQWKARAGVREIRVRSDPDLLASDTLTAWIEVQPSTNSMRVRIADSAGREQISAQPEATAATFASGGWLTAHVFSSLPRRERFLRLRVYAEAGGSFEPVAEFRVRNPAYRRSSPAWKPEPLPITRETNGFQFTLTRFSTGLFATGTLAHTFGSNWTLIEYECEAGAWHPIAVTLTDASGNRIRRRDPMQRLGSDTSQPRATDPSRYRGAVSVPAMLWLDEPAWNVRLELERRGRMGFRTNEFWEVSKIAVPAPGTTNFLKLSPQNHGTNLRVQAISTQETPRRSVRIEVSRAPASDLRLSLVKATDTRGTNILFITEPTRDHRTVFRLAAVPPEAERLNLRFAVHGVMALDFIARPQLLQTNIAGDP